jgi:hypothetical protein
MDGTSGLVGSAGGRLVRIRPVDPAKPLAVFLPHQDPGAFFARITDKYSGLVSGPACEATVCCSRRSHAKYFCERFDAQVQLPLCQRSQ